MLSNNYLQIRGIKKTDEGTYRCEGRILARGEINFKDIQVIVNGEQPWAVLGQGQGVWHLHHGLLQVLQWICTPSLPSAC